ncbi:hypothetical protein, partial [Streptomyces fagopyri]
MERAEGGITTPFDAWNSLVRVDGVGAGFLLAAAARMIPEGWGESHDAIRRAYARLSERERDLNTQSQAQIISNLLLHGEHATGLLRGGATRLTDAEYEEMLKVWFEGEGDLQVPHDRLPRKKETVEITVGAGEAVGEGTSQPARRSINVGVMIASLKSMELGRASLTAEAQRLLRLHGTLDRVNDKWVFTPEAGGGEVQGDVLPRQGVSGDVLSDDAMVVDGEPSGPVLHGFLEGGDGGSEGEAGGAGPSFVVGADAGLHPVVGRGGAVGAGAGAGFLGAGVMPPEDVPRLAGEFLRDEGNWLAGLLGWSAEDLVQVWRDVNLKLGEKAAELTAGVMDRARLQGVVANGLQQGRTEDGMAADAYRVIVQHRGLHPVRDAGEAAFVWRVAGEYEASGPRGAVVDHAVNALRGRRANPP